MENLLYLLSACLLITGLKMLGSPKTAVRGNAIGAIGMLIAAGVALLLSRGADRCRQDLQKVVICKSKVGLLRTRWNVLVSSTARKSSSS